MDFKNKYLLMTVRIIFGLFFLFAGIAGFFGAKAIVSGHPMAGLTEQDIDMTKAFWETGIIQLAKFMEVTIGVMLVFNLLPALATVFMTPLTIGIIVYNASLNPMNLPISIVMGLLNVYLVYVYFDKYKPLLICDLKKKKVSKK